MTQPRDAAVTDVVEEINKLAEKTVRRPWAYTYDGSSAWSIGQAPDPQADKIAHLAVSPFRWDTCAANAEFIVSLVNAWPEISERLRAAEAAIEALTTLLAVLPFMDDEPTQLKMDDVRDTLEAWRKARERT